MVSNDTLMYTVNEGIEQQKDTLFYKACDIFNGCDTAMVILNINLDAGTIAPIANNDTLTVNSIEAVAISVLNNDIDPIGGLLTLEIIELPNFGSTTILDYGNPSIAYTINTDATNENEDQLTYVACSENGLCDTAQVVFLLDVISGINSPLNFDKKVKMYPNPANEVLFIETLLQAGELVLYNAQGQAIESYQAGAGKAEIKTKKLTEGLYYVQFKTETLRAYMGKFLVVHD